MDIINIGIIASVDSGKTTLTEKIIEATSDEYKAGKIEKQDTTTDFHSFERERGITVFSEGIYLNYKGIDINLIDTPGHVDFFEETKKSLLALDMAILVISAIDGITDRVRDIYQVIKSKNIPILVFINKCDIPHGNPLKTYTDLKEISSSFVSLKDEEGLYDKLSNLSDDFMDNYLNEKLTEELIESEVKKQVLYGNLNLVVKGSAIDGRGINELLNLLTKFYPKYIKDDEGVNWGLVYKVKYSQKEGLLAYIKVLSGTFNLKEEIETEKGIRKINEIRKYKGKDYINISNLKSGDLGVIRGLEDVEVGEYIGILAPREYKPSKTNFTTSFKSIDYMKLKEAFDILNKEETFLNPKFNKDLSQIEVSSYGKVHLEILREILKERFHLESKFLPPIPKYMETISDTTTGFCHYEPKKHYARVEVEISPYFENSFESKVSLDYLPFRFQSIIEKTIPEALSCGVLLGRGLKNVKVTLIDGKAHEEHTHGGDFRIAVIRAVTQALERNTNILLEPSLNFKVKLTNDSFKLGDKLKQNNISYEFIKEKNYECLVGVIPISFKERFEKIVKEDNLKITFSQGDYLKVKDQDKVVEELKGRFYRDEKLFNSVSLFREKKKMKKVR